MYSWLNVLQIKLACYFDSLQFVPSTAELRKPLVPLMLHLCQITFLKQVARFTETLELKEVIIEGMEFSEDSEEQRLIDANLEPVKWYVFYFLLHSTLLYSTSTCVPVNTEPLKLRSVLANGWTFYPLSGWFQHGRNSQTLHQSGVMRPLAWTACGRQTGSARRPTSRRGTHKVTRDVWPGGSFFSPAPSALSSWPERWLVRGTTTTPHRFLKYSSFHVVALWSLTLTETSYLRIR